MLIDIAVKFFVPVIIGFFAGLYIDKQLSTVPLVAIIMGFSGFLAGIYIIYKTYNK